MENFAMHGKFMFFEEQWKWTIRESLNEYVEY